MKENSGLSSAQASQLLANTGANEIPENKPSKIKKLVLRLASPISLMLFAAAGLSYFTGKTFDGSFILLLLFLNVGISIWQETKADSAIAKLNEKLESTVPVKRDGQWQEIPSKLLVPGDLVRLTLGHLIPADGTLLSGENLTVNESVLTGESFPKEKPVGEKLFSGSFVATGNGEMSITSTGKNTYFGKTIFSVERDRGKSALEKDILRIAQFLEILSIAAVVIISSVFLFEHANIPELLTLDLSLIIAGVPVSLPTVMTLIIELGVLELAKKNVIVRRLSALEDFANVNLLLSDKTGTLTENRITVQNIIPFGLASDHDVLHLASIVAAEDPKDPINSAVLAKSGEVNLGKVAYRVLKFIPADPERKHATAIIEGPDKTTGIVSVGAPQVIAKLSALDKKAEKDFFNRVDEFADQGFRTVAVATGDNSKTEKDLKLIGLLTLSDTLRADAADTLTFLEDNGIAVKMLTGDNRAIAATVGKKLGLSVSGLATHNDLVSNEWKNAGSNFFSDHTIFSEILPKDKLGLTQSAGKYFTVAVTGDGINDLPAVKTASVGIAVANAVEALKSTADIVLLSSGISVIKDAILESRKIFARLYTYSVYRISESLRLIVTITILGVVYRLYPLTPLQIIVITLLNDIPIISLAFNRVKTTSRPAKINVKERFFLSSLFGLVGVANSILLFILAVNILHLPWPVVQTLYFLKLTVSGHLLIFVAHTKDRWWKFLPSREVIIATMGTQLIATVLAVTGFLMPGKLPVFWAVFAWIWAFLWMQVGEITKLVNEKFGEKES